MSPQYHRPAAPVGQVDQILTLGDEHRCRALRTPTGTEGNACYLRVGLTTVSFSFYGLSFREPGSLDAVIADSLQLREGY